MRVINRKLVVGAGAVALLVVGGAGIAAAGGGSPDSETGGENSGGAITGDALQRASDTSLAETGGGTVTARTSTIRTCTRSTTPPSS